MHDIEPHYRWRELYVAAEDDRSPFYGRQYSEFQYSQKVYNYYIHPQWDSIGSSTLYIKILYADYVTGYAIIELIGEWNDALHNDVMYLKREIIDHLDRQGIHQYILLCENVMSYHADDDSYYEEWYEDVADEDGWVVLLDVRDHVLDEMNSIRLRNYINFGEDYNDISWRKMKPRAIYLLIKDLVE